MVWDLAQWGSANDGTKVMTSPYVYERAVTGYHFQLGTNNGQHHAHTVQDLGACPSQCRRLRCTVVLVLRTASEEF